MTDNNEITQLKKDLRAAKVEIGLLMAEIEQKNLDITHLKWALVLATAAILLMGFILSFS